MSKRIPIILGLILTMIALWLLLSHNLSVRIFLERLNSIGYEIQLRARISTHKPSLSPIAIVDIDDKSLLKEGHWPWSREKMAKLLEKIIEQGVTSISFDMFFSEAQSNLAETVLEKLKNSSSGSSACIADLNNNKSLFDQDAIFAKSMEKSRAILAYAFIRSNIEQNTLAPSPITVTPEQLNKIGIREEAGYIANLPILQKAANGTGFINIDPDLDGQFRHAPLIKKYKNNIYPALSLATLLALFPNKLTLITPSYGDSIKLEGIQLGDYKIPTDERGSILIPFVGKGRTFQYFSATDILNNKIPPDALTGKYIIIGTTAVGLGDLHVTPIQAVFPGVEIQATLLNGLIQHNITQIPAWSLGVSISLVILSGLLAAFLFPYLGPGTLSFFMAGLPITLFVASYWVWIKTGYLISIVVPILLLITIILINIVYGFIFEKKRRMQLKDMFGQYVPESHITEMLYSKSAIELGGESRLMSVLFADIRNFTNISENMNPSDLVKMLNNFFTPMTEVIFKHDGTIDKYVGDLIMAFWGAPLEDKEHQRHAIESALLMQAKLSELKAEFSRLNYPKINIGIGINTGIMTVGDVGSKYRRNYTVLGDSVNLASRVEGLTKYYGVDIIVTENTRENQDDFIFRTLDKVAVKGRKSGILIYEVIGSKDELTTPLKNELEKHEEAIKLYFAQQWDKAKEILQTLSKANPSKKIYTVLLDHIQEFKNHPPGPDWDGVYVHKNK